MLYFAKKKNTFQKKEKCVYFFLIGNHQRENNKLMKCHKETKMRKDFPLPFSQLQTAPDLISRFSGSLFFPSESGGSDGRHEKKPFASREQQ